MRDHFRLLYQTVDLVCRFPFDEQLDWARHSSRSHTLLVLFLRLCGGLLTNVSLLFAVFHFYDKRNGKKKSYKLQ